MDDAHGALLHAQLTALALGLIDVGHIVLHGDGLLGAGLGALHAANAARGAGLPGQRTLVLVLTQDHRLALVLRDDGDHTVGADCGAGAAAGALLPVHLGDAVHDVDGVEGAGPGAVAVAQTAELAQSVAAVQALDRLAAVQALKLKALAGLPAGTGAGHHGLHGDGGASLHAHDGGDLAGHLGTAGDALVDGVAVLHDGLGVVGAAGAATGAAVGAGQDAGVGGGAGFGGGGHHQVQDENDPKNPLHLPPMSRLAICRHANHLLLFRTGEEPRKRPRKSARVRQVPGFAPPFAQAAFVPRRAQNKGEYEMRQGLAASAGSAAPSGRPERKKAPPASGTTCPPAAWRRSTFGEVGLNCRVRNGIG